MSGVQAPPQPLPIFPSGQVERGKGDKDCKPGTELVDYFTSAITKRTIVLYDYRTFEGELFTCVGWDIEECRQKRDHWIMVKQHKQRMLALHQMINEGME